VLVRSTEEKWVTSSAVAIPIQFLRTYSRPSQRVSDRVARCNHSTTPRLLKLQARTLVWGAAALVRRQPRPRAATPPNHQVASREVLAQ
jgi:hypothetical protein